MPGSEEGKVNIERIASNNLSGGYASFTDKNWQPSDSAAGNYRCITSGLVLVNGVVASFNYLTNELESDQYKQGLDIVRNVAGESS